MAASAFTETAGGRARALAARCLGWMRGEGGGRGGANAIDARSSARDARVAVAGAPAYQHPGARRDLVTPAEDLRVCVKCEYDE